MSLNFCRRNIQKHYNKQKQNCQCSYIHQQLKLHKIFKPLQNQKTRTMQKQQYQIKNRMHWVFRFCHLKNTSKRTCCNQSKRGSHLYKRKNVHFLPEPKACTSCLNFFESEGIRTHNLRIKRSLLCQLSYKLWF